MVLKHRAMMLCGPMCSVSASGATHGKAGSGGCNRPNKWTVSGNDRAGDGKLVGSLRQTQATQPELGPDLTDLELQVKRLAPDITRIKIGDAQHKRWEVPANLLGLSTSGMSSAAPTCS